jgi:RimJ/RimL family protein N-acetyltransferase
MTTTAETPTFPARRDLTDGVVLLREPVAGDVPAIIRGASTPDVARFTRVPSPYAAEHAQELLDIATNGWAAATDGVWAVCDAGAPDALLGLVGLHGVDLTGTPGGAGEIGYWLAPEGRGRGLMTRAVRLVSAWAVDELGVTRIDWFALTANPASRRVVERCGYVVEGVIRRGALLRGARQDHWIGGLLAEDLVR